MKKVLKLNFLTLASLPACGWAEPSFTAFFELGSGASADLPLMMAAFMLFIIPPLPALELLSRSEVAIALTASFSFLPSEPFRRKTSKRVGRLFGDAIPKMIERNLDFIAMKTNTKLTVNRELIRDSIFTAFSPL